MTAAWARTAQAAPRFGHVVVIGAGILGATIACHLARRGVHVTVLEKSSPASGATGDSFAYLNASTKKDRPYHELNALGMAGWHRLQAELNGALPLRWGGAVYWQTESAAAKQLLETLRRCQEWGYAGRRIDDAELRSLLPSAVPGHIESAVLFEQEGAIDPSGAVDVLLAHAKKLGARVQYPVDVTGFEVADNRVRRVRTADGAIEADAVVVAAVLDRVVFAPGSTIRQTIDGRIVSSDGYQGATPEDSLAEQGRRILNSAARYFPGLKDARIARVSVGKRVLPADGFPVLGFAGSFTNIYVTVTHSGVTLAPIIAQYATQELLDGVAVERLAPYRPSRFSWRGSASVPSADSPNSWRSG